MCFGMCSHSHATSNNVRVVLAEGQTLSCAGATHLVAGGTERRGEDGEVKFTNDMR